MDGDLSSRSLLLLMNGILIAGSSFCFYSPIGLFNLSYESPNYTIFALRYAATFNFFFLWIMFSIAIPYFLKPYTRAIRYTIRALMRGVIGFVLGTALFHVIAILYGAPFVVDFERTLLWSSLLSSMVFLPMSCLVGSDLSSWYRFLSISKPLNLFESLYYIPGMTCMLGAWLGAFPIPLDWDRPWQVWPISCTYGAMSGYLLGLSACAFVNVFYLHQKDS